MRQVGERKGEEGRQVKRQGGRRETRTPRKETEGQI